MQIFSRIAINTSQRPFVFVRCFFDSPLHDLTYGSVHDIIKPTALRREWRTNMSDIKININRTEGNNKKKKNRFFSDTIFLWGGAMLSCYLWGSAFPVIKIGYREFSISSDNMAAQILFAGIRFLLAGIAVVITGSIMERRIIIPKKSSASKIFKLSFFQTVAQYTFFYIGLSHTSGVRASIVQGTNVFVALFVAGLIYKLEKLGPKKMIGCAIGFSGVVLVNLSGTDLGKGSFLTGDLPIILSTVAYAFSSVL